MTRMRQHTPMRGQMRRLAVPLLALMAVTACMEGDAADDDDALVVATASMESSAFEPTDAVREEVLATLQQFFDALGGEADLLADIIDPTTVGHSVVMGDGGVPRVGQLSIDDLEERITNGEVPMIERMWDPEVRVSGSLATVWTPYDFYNGDQFSHCGVDVVTMIHNGERWEIKSLDFNRQQPPTCELHPDGPPGG